MASQKIMQGDAYALPFEVTINEKTIITPDLVSEIEICIGTDDLTAVRKTYSSGGVWYDYNEKTWYFRLNQEETLSMDPGGYTVIARVKFNGDSNADVIGTKIGSIVITDTFSEEVI